MPEEQELEERGDEEPSGDETETVGNERGPSAEEPEGNPHSNFLPRQIDDDHDATWILTP